MNGKLEIIRELRKVFNRRVRNENKEIVKRRIYREEN